MVWPIIGKMGGFQTLHLTDVAFASQQKAAAYKTVSQTQNWAIFCVVRMAGGIFKVCGILVAEEL
jgi:hypothetical protein